MGQFWGRVFEIRISPGRQLEACIACPSAAIPQPGQYLLASDVDDTSAALATPLFTSQTTSHGFWAAPPIPNGFNPGTNLNLVGPLGHGFVIPHAVKRLCLLALGESALRLLPLTREKGEAQRNLTLFTDLLLPPLPSTVEAYPTSSLREALDWPDFMAIDLPLHRLDELRGVLGLSGSDRLPFPAQVLVTTPMPCAGLAACGACAVPGRRGWKLTCEDGPVFNLDMLKW